MGNQYSMCLVIGDYVSECLSPFEPMPNGLSLAGA